MILFRARGPTLTPGGISQGGARQAGRGQAESAQVLEVVGDQVVNGLPGRQRGRGEHGRGLLEVALELGLRRVVVVASRVPRDPCSS